MSYHSGTGGNSLLNPIVDGAKINGIWMEYVEDSLDTVLGGNHRIPATFLIDAVAAVYSAYTNGQLVYGGATNAGGADGTDADAVLQACVDDVATGDVIEFTAKGFPFNTAITIPNGTKCLTFRGQNSFGKDYAEAGNAYTGTHLKTSEAVMFTNGYTDNTRSVFGLQFQNIKFEGPTTVGSVCLDLKNVDYCGVDLCSFFNFGTSIKSTYEGAALGLAEQPGLGPITRNLFAQGQTRYIHLEQNTQTYIEHNVFQSFGPFTNTIYALDCDKIEVHGNEFNIPTVPANMTEFIKIEYNDATFPCTGWRIDENWAYRSVTGIKWIRTAGTQAIYAINSRNNVIFQGFVPNYITDTGPYVLGDTALHFIDGDDFITPPSGVGNQLRDLTATYTAGTAYQNQWSPVTLHFRFLHDSDDSCSVQLGVTEALLFTVSAVQGTAGDSAKSDMITIQVPSMHWWKAVVTGGATQEGLIAVYR